MLARHVATTFTALINTDCLSVYRCHSLSPSVSFRCFLTFVVRVVYLGKQSANNVSRRLKEEDCFARYKR